MIRLFFWIMQELSFIILKSIMGYHKRLYFYKPELMFIQIHKTFI